MLVVNGQKAGIRAKEVVLRLGLTPTDHLCTEQNLTTVYLSLHGQLCDAVKLSSVSYDNPCIKQTGLRRGGVCMYINNDWCIFTDIMRTHCFPDIEGLYILAAAAPQHYSVIFASLNVLLAKCTVVYFIKVICLNLVVLRLLSFLPHT